MSAPMDLVTLKVQNRTFQCSRELLKNHSDYFRVMFEGPFVESELAEITLNDVEYSPLQAIIKVITTKDYAALEVSVNHAISVLKAASMLQFLAIKDTCIAYIRQKIALENCLKIWLVTERFAIPQLYRKARLIAVIHFMEIKSLPSFSELSLDDLERYLSDSYLQCNNECDVAEAINHWCSKLTNEENLIELLKKCVYFNSVTIKEIEDMICLFNKKSEVRIFLKKILDIKLQKEVKDDSLYKKLFESDKCRNKGGFPAIFVHNPDQSGNMNPNIVYHYDKFKRKRKYTILNETINNDCFGVYSIDHENAALKYLFPIPKNICNKLDGYKIISHKTNIFLLGGQGDITKDHTYNNNMYIYDVINETWKTIQFPFRRRHFECCINGNFLYIVGGTGLHRIIKDYVFYYDFKNNIWSKEISTPLRGRQLKCCIFEDKLLLVDVNTKTIDILEDTNIFTRTKILDADNVLPGFSQSLIVFTTCDKLCLKGEKLFVLQRNENVFHITDIIDIEGSAVNPYYDDCLVQSVLCNNVLYCVKKQLDEETNPVWLLEVMNFDLSSRRPTQMMKINGIFQNPTIIKNKCHLNLFNVFHPDLI